MNLDEFNLKKETLIEYIIHFEQLQRKVNLLKTSYILEFHKELEEDIKLNIENDALLQAIAMKTGGKKDEDIHGFLEQKKTKFYDQQRIFYQQYNSAKSIEKQCSKYTPKDMEVLDDTFKAYCTKYHPLVHIKATENERNLYPLIITVYRMGNLQGFNSLLKENANEYLKSIQDLREMISKLKQEFPLNKEEMFYKEDALIREQMELREKIYQLRDMNKALHKDFLLQFSFDFKI